MPSPFPQLRHKLQFRELKVRPTGPTGGALAFLEEASHIESGWEIAWRIEFRGGRPRLDPAFGAAAELVTPAGLQHVLSARYAQSRKEDLLSLTTISAPQVWPMRLNLWYNVKQPARASEPAADYPLSSCPNRLLGVATMLRLLRHGWSVALESGLALAS